MFERRLTTTSPYDEHMKAKKRVTFFNIKSSNLRHRFSIGILCGICLTFITIILQLIAFVTPHWKEISPNTHSVYLDNIDALIRTEIFHYFENIHRYTRHSYGLFHRCEYVINNSSKVLFHQQKICTKNYLPSFDDDNFNECHSLPYYTFCIKQNERKYDINNDYLRAKFDITYSQSSSVSYACACHYPPYAVVSHTIGILALICLFLTAILFISFPFLTDTYQRLKLKCFAILSSILAMIFLMINLIVIFEHLEYESVEYLIAIRRHYKLAQIYKLSEDTKIAIERFLRSIQISLGYSAILAWIAFGLSIIDGLFILLTCKIKHDQDENETQTNLLTSQSDEQRVSTPLQFGAVSNESQLSSYPPNEKSRIEYDNEV